MGRQFRKPTVSHLPIAQELLMWKANGRFLNDSAPSLVKITNPNPMTQKKVPVTNTHHTGTDSSSFSPKGCVAIYSREYITW